MPVFDAKAKKELVIMDISETEAPVEGGKKIIILCEKVLREDIKVRFWDPLSGWEGWGQFSAQVCNQNSTDLETVSAEQF